jgi:hypothetical protein
MFQVHKKHLTTCDSGGQQLLKKNVCQVLAKLECVGWIEEILELNYGVLNVVVLLCDWVKVNYIGSSATVK